ncbi:hypothetical protein [Arhodomonas sp. SL1]|uniref:hypothetical protein n=1 Tax=Arhodomonas sp. SL1 TaxID=3425691 RepID=UPI003F882B42
MNRMAGPWIGVLAALLLAVQPLAAGERQCLLIDPAVIGRIPPLLPLGQLERPRGGDDLRVLIGDSLVVDLTLAERPGVRAAQVLAAARMLEGPATEIALRQQWRPEPARCVEKDMPAAAVLVGRIAAATPPASLPPGDAFRRVLLIDLPAATPRRELGAWRTIWGKDVPVTVLPLAAPRLAPAAGEGETAE